MSQQDDLIIECKKHIGEMSLYTGENPDWAWCARFLVSCMRDIGMEPPDTWSAKGLYDWCEPVPDDAVQSGDLVCFNFDGREDTSWFDHVGLVMWFDHDSDEYKTIEGNSGSDYSVGCYEYYNETYPPKTYFCRPPYDARGEYTMNESDFNEMWCNHSFNAPMIDGKWSPTPGNVMLTMYNAVMDMREQLHDMEERLEDMERSRG